mgnify:FL=1
MDQLERSFQEEQAGINESIRVARESKSSLKPTGYCHRCYEDVSPDQIYCDVNCAEAHTAHLRLKGYRH